MATSEQIEEFSCFAKRISAEEGAELPLDVIFDRWHQETHEDEDMRAIQAADRGYQQGERGRPVSEFLQAFDAT